MVRSPQNYTSIGLIAFFKTCNIRNGGTEETPVWVSLVSVLFGLPSARAHRFSFSLWVRYTGKAIFTKFTNVKDDDEPSELSLTDE
ncbi:uncharacterized protein N7458_004603 [Penicillium daleae]|uniref:Uncharacterized protein n=1 Tax=Penicillium daleae TaxID=63821 RepID=A0AAD6C6E6_9EURO|nr:uncharacterized protein N7458_004603 [Penicillium daleae]KAJ5453647.1 hypothetical protein N7458_004603 [Penicillium daleae]